MSISYPQPVTSDDALLHSHHFLSDGAPTDGSSGTHADVAPVGALLIDKTNGLLYINTGTKASPTWTVVGDQTAA